MPRRLQACIEYLRKEKCTQRKIQKTPELLSQVFS
jgi:hypothetical protein